MLAQLVSIGNSKGIRIPATLLRQYGLSDTVELLPGKDEITIRPVRGKPREGWEQAFSAMHACGDDQLLIDDTLDQEDWEWS
ncbi:MAG: AbrB/MazE/SpoVT family DNA-binding domain-containing protein [Trichlorobacter sp.]|uniref:AbrB/MazE/SpoVT family DNA-binding domain-containing protein n=1 Tax=Trichlorobacter sp. TaxID=2911007 RepID=UPI002563D4F7|nr:AbrB/MazE/SpoVT family DNA-binding domain-containing protein [Trichlorobacter sp.]MDK9719540.1 AbrB/MazE/SpoVT family DNA-binding domain-containing protein [Trichlorobacter sp.]